MQHFPIYLFEYNCLFLCLQMKKLIILFIFLPVCSFAQISSGEFYTFYYKINMNDTAGLYTKLFIENKDSKDFYSLLSKGNYFLKVGKTKEALSEFTGARTLTNVDQYDSLKALVDFNIGNTYLFNDNYPEALRYYNKVVLVFKGQAKIYLQAKFYSQLGLIHFSLGKQTDAISNFKIALEYYRSKNDKSRLVSIQNNVALAYMNSGNYAMASIYFDSCLAYRKSMKDAYGMGQTLNNMGTMYFNKGDYKGALEFFETGYAKRIEGKAPVTGMIESKINIGKTKWKLGNKADGVKWLEEAFNQALAINNFELQGRVSQQLKDLYVDMKQYEKAYKMQGIYFIVKDSLYGLDKKNAIDNFVLQNQFEIKMQRDSISAAEKINREKIVSAEKEKSNRIVVIVLSAGLLFLLYFVFNLYRSNQHRKRANKIIMEQKDALNQKHKEVTDSMYYAKRIQQSLLPTEKYIERILNKLKKRD